MAECLSPKQEVASSILAWPAMKERRRRKWRRFSANNKEFDVADKIVRTKKEGRIKRWWRETIGELHKVNWPTPKEAWRLTKIVIMVMACHGSIAWRT